MNSGEAFKRFVIDALYVKFIDHQNLKTHHINNHIEEWVESCYVEITVWDVDSHVIKLTELGKSMVIMGRL